MTYEKTFQMGDFPEADRFVYKLGWLNRAFECK